MTGAETTSANLTTAKIVRMKQMLKMARKVIQALSESVRAGRDHPATSITTEAPQMSNVEIVKVTHQFVCYKRYCQCVYMISFGQHTFGKNLALKRAVRIIADPIEADRR